MEAEAD